MVDRVGNVCHFFPLMLVGSSLSTMPVGAIETGFTAFVVRRIGVVTKATIDFTPVFFAPAGLATFAMAVVLFLVRPRWFNVE